MHISELNKSTYNEYYQTYISTLKEVELVSELQARLDSLVPILEAIKEEDYNYSYAAGKWSIRALLLHIIDTERVLQYRAFTFARNNGCALNGFEQDDYVVNSYPNLRSKSSLIDEFITVRKSSISLFSSFDKEIFNNAGKIEGSPMSVGAAGFIICGHQKHHENVIIEKYLPSLK